MRGLQRMAGRSTKLCERKRTHEPCISSTSIPTASQIGTRVWSYAGVLRDDGLSYMAYVEQITFLLFLKMISGRRCRPTTSRTESPREGMRVGRLRAIGRVY